MRQTFLSDVMPHVHVIEANVSGRFVRGLSGHFQGGRRCRHGQHPSTSRDESIALPLFRADMLPNELEELLESSILKLYGEGSAAVSTEGLWPHAFGGQSGVLFDISAAVTESPDYRGVVAALISEERLYMIIFLAAEPYYYDKHIAEAEAVIGSASL